MLQPIYALQTGPPHSTPPVPEWGHLPLDIYMLEQWHVPHPHSAWETVQGRCRRLARQFMQLGAIRREPYIRRTDPHSPLYSPARPTEEQIEHILRPYRPDGLRRFALAAGINPIWMRICYDADSPDAHDAIWREFMCEKYQAACPGSLIFNDPTTFGTDNVDLALEAFPERVINTSRPEYAHVREAALQCLRGGDTSRWTRLEGQYEDILDQDEIDAIVIRERFVSYHIACIVTYILVEDMGTLMGDGVLLVFLDDMGNVVRQDRMSPEQVDNFEIKWRTGRWKYYAERYAQEVGPAYLNGGVRGPPYW
ncbi:uncharacterized protein ACHE_11434A [Aspergillus chevalieri]|uniref:Uncharacterized protein n=1 Tax=Aspergillus chevalieri TaxID=182096 RepID=A0A7R7ZKF9_ASPCH|nr:uncharacterized protein ACHE_11434A [Aspergillus chevalieri]BCR84032.1 hypothetical protein ACHE_11434A [Aspergillus chevalieri]